MRSAFIELPQSHHSRRPASGTFPSVDLEDVLDETFETTVLLPTSGDEGKGHARPPSARPPSRNRQSLSKEPRRPRRRGIQLCLARLRKIISSTLFLLVAIGVLHVVVLRMKAIKKLGTVLNIFGRAEYYPITNDVYTENNDLGMRYRRMLSELVSAENKRKVTEPMPTMPSSAGGCTATYSMNLTDHEARMVDLDDYDRELLGTIMVRLCDCSCVGRGQVPLNGSLALMEEILKGAHIVVRSDRGAFYSYFTQMQDSYKRTSSHQSIVPMYGIPEGQVLRTMLTGRNHEGDTWFQFEGANWAPLKRPAESWVHAVNYVQYLITGRQVGPLGDSVHTDSYPIHVDFDGCTDTKRVLFSQYEKDDRTGMKEEKPQRLRLF